MEDADRTCPYCNRPLRVDHDGPETCAMCGMDIHHPDLGAKLLAGSGRTLYFCSIWCLRIYRRKVRAEAHEAIERVAARTRGDQ